MLAAFRLAWQEYLRLLEAESKTNRDWMKFRTGKNDPIHDEIRRVGNNFDDIMQRDQATDSNDARQCLQALTCFVRFLPCDQKYKGWDGYFRDIFNARHLAFKKMWVDALDGIAKYILVLCPRSDTAKWNQLLTATRSNYNWLDIESKINDAKAQVERESNAAEDKIAIRARNIAALPRFLRPSKSELPEPHTLERMRGLLCEM